jgi:hypothetical protein
MVGGRDDAMTNEDDTLSSIPRLKQRALDGDPLALELLVACASSPDAKTANSAADALAAVAAVGDRSHLRSLETARAKLGAHAALDVALAALRARLNP